MFSVYNKFGENCAGKMFKNSAYYIDWVYIAWRLLSITMKWPLLWWEIYRKDNQHAKRLLEYKISEHLTSRIQFIIKEILKIYKDAILEYLLLEIDKRYQNVDIHKNNV